MQQQIAVNTLPFWSRFVVEYDLRYDGVTCIRRLITRGTRIPVFDYRQGEAQATALNGAQATARDTILVKAAQTRGGGRYTINGLSITKDGMPYENAANSNGLTHQVFPAASVQPCNGDSGPLVLSVEDMRSLNNFTLQAFLQTFRVQLNIDGTRRTIEMGPALLYPGQGGAKDSIESANGDVFVSNFMPIPEGIFWNPSGAVDSNMVVQLEAAYDLDAPTWTTPTGTADGGAVTQENPEIPYANRTALGRQWQQGFVLNFHGREESPTSNVS
jgi:hypothetical protein